MLHKITWVMCSMAVGIFATTEAKAAAARNPDAAEINVKLGEGYMAKGELKRALDKLTRATELDPKYSPAYTLLAMLHEQINDPVLAEKNYKKAIALEPKSGAAANNYGAFLCRHDREAEGVKQFDRALKDPFYETPDMALVNKGSCATGMGDLAMAESALREALQRNEKNSDALFGLARLSFEQKQYMKARAFVERYASVSRMTPDILALGMMIEKELGDVKRADEYKSRLLQNYPDSEQARSLSSLDKS